MITSIGKKVLALIWIAGCLLYIKVNISATTITITGSLASAKTVLDVGPLGSGHSFSTITLAIYKASDGDEIVVYPGTYKDHVSFSGKAITVRSTNPDDHQVVANTIIDGGVRFGYEEGNDSVLQGVTIQNSTIVAGIWCSGSSPTVIGCTIIGNSTIPGVVCMKSSPIITGCTIRGNSAKSQAGMGGGIFCLDSSLTVTNCTISGNSAKSGGGIHFDRGSSLTVTNCTISGNSADSGGGILCTGSSVTITDCTISGNSGSGISCYSATITGCTISGNSGCGIGCSSSNVADCIIRENPGGGISCSSSTIADCTINKNSGGGISGSSATITDCTISENFGCGIDCTSLNITGSTISENSDRGINCSSLNIADCFIRKNSGGGISCCSADITNCIVNENSAKNGAGINCDHGYKCSLNITDCTISGNTADEWSGGIYAPGGSLTITDSIIIGNSAYHLVGAGIYADPITATGCTISDNVVLNYPYEYVVDNEVFWGVSPDCEITRKDTRVAGYTANAGCITTPNNIGGAYYYTDIGDFPDYEDVYERFIEGRQTTSYLTKQIYGNVTPGQGIYLDGYFTDADTGAPVENVTIKLNARQQQTNAQGYYRFSNLQKGTSYNLKAKKDNYCEYIGTVTLDDNKAVNIKLEPLDKKGEIPPPNSLVLEKEIKDILEDEVFTADSGYDLDQYVFKSHMGAVTHEPGCLEFSIDIGRYCGPIDEQGGLVTCSQLKDMGAQVKLVMAAYDVDNKFLNEEYKPEKDEVYINGHKLEKDLLVAGQENGAGKWIRYECQLPLEYLKFPQKGDKAQGITPARNDICIKIDRNNTQLPDDVWAVAIDWAYFRFSGFPRPIVFIHGKSDNSLGWKIYADNGHDDMYSGGWYTWFEKQGFVVGAADVWSQGNPFGAMRKMGVNTNSDYLDNDGDQEIDEDDETNAVHLSNPLVDWNTIPAYNSFCFSDMLDTEETSIDFTSWVNMKGMANLAKMFGTQKVHFVSHSTGCFYGREYIHIVMDSDTRNKKRQGYEEYPLVDKFIMISGPNNGQPVAKVFKELYGVGMKLKGEYSPCEKFYTEDEWITFNQIVKPNKFVNYYTIGGYSGWRANDTPDPTRPYCDLNNWHPTYGGTLSKLAIAAYWLLGGKYGEDWEEERKYEVTCLIPIQEEPYFEEITYERTHIPNDCLCTLGSMSLGGCEIPLGNFPLSHHNTRTYTGVKNLIYEALLPNQETVPRARARKGSLSASPEEVPARKFVTQSPPNIPAMPSQYTYQDGTIASSEVKDLELTLPANLALIHLIWDKGSGGLHLLVTGPDGAVVPDSDVTNEPGHIFMTPSSFLPGTWKFAITSSQLSTGTDYHLVAYLGEPAIQLKPATEKHDYLVGEKVTLTTELASAAGPITNAIVEADMYSVADHALLGRITLFDDGSHGDMTPGDGIYTDDEWIPGQRGKQQFEITAHIIQNSREIYNQSTDILINVIDDRITFNGDNSDQREDANGNGAYDSLKISIGLTSSVAGNYTFSAELYDPNGNFISTAHEQVRLDSGNNVVLLSFDGRNIFDLGFNGPYHLKNAAIVSDTNELMALGEQVYATGPYAHTDFEGPAISLSGARWSAEWIADDESDEYNNLKWNFQLSVAVEGTYVISASLKTPIGQVIETVSSSRHLNAGEDNVWSLYFDGLTIRACGSDGPYFIDDVTITGEGNRLSAEKVYTIDSFHPSDSGQPYAPDLEGNTDCHDADGALNPGAGEAGEVPCNDKDDDCKDDDCEEGGDGTICGQRECSEEKSGELDIEGITGRPGREVRIPVKILTSPAAVSDFGFEVTYDSSVLEFSGFNDTRDRGDLVKSFSMVTANPDPDDPGRIIIRGVSSENEIPQGAYGDLVWLRFMVTGGQEGNCYLLHLENLEGHIAGFSRTGGCFCMSSRCDGDLNEDGGISPADALSAISCYLQSGPCSDCADVNGDGGVTPQDALCLLNKYLEQPSCLDLW